MTRKWIARLEIWNNSAQPKVTEIDQPGLEKAIRLMADERCADILIDDMDKDYGDGTFESFPSFIINSSEGKYSVTAFLAEDKCYDLVGDSLVIGWHDFIMGGQETPYPVKYIVSLEQAVAVASDYLDIREAIITKYNWDNQNDPTSAWNQK